MFDPELDAALIYAPDVDVPVLPLATTCPHRGQQAAAIGFPGGGREQVIAAAHQPHDRSRRPRHLRQSTVAREVLEMQADVRPGDSGGPLMLPDGTVGGVTFSESRDDPDIGYALDAHLRGTGHRASDRQSVAGHSRPACPSPDP